MPLRRRASPAWPSLHNHSTSANLPFNRAGAAIRHWSPLPPAGTHGPCRRPRKRRWRRLSGEPAMSPGLWLHERNETPPGKAATGAMEGMRTPGCHPPWSQPPRVPVSQSAGSLGYIMKLLPPHTPPCSSPRPASGLLRGPACRTLPPSVPPGHTTPHKAQPLSSCPADQYWPPLKRPSPDQTSPLRPGRSG